MSEIQINFEDKKAAKRLDVLLSMHAYNDSSGRHHEESGRRGANVFMLIYFFLTGIVITNGLSVISFFVALFLVAIATIGYSMARQHSGIARMHYYRNRLIRDQIDEIFSEFKPSLALIFDEARAKTVPFELKPYIYSAYHRHWARIHSLFIIIGLGILILDAVNQVSCFWGSGCFWTKGNDITTLLPHLKSLFSVTPASP